jgi:hypothetical protein
VPRGNHHGVLAHLRAVTSFMHELLAAPLAGGFSCSSQTYVASVRCRCVVPISALFSGTLWLGNAAYLYLSVAFIQMLKVRTWQ